MADMRDLLRQIDATSQTRATPALSENPLPGFNMGSVPSMEAIQRAGDVAEKYRAQGQYPEAAGAIARGAFDFFREAVPTNILNPVNALNAARDYGSRIARGATTEQPAQAAQPQAVGDRMPQALMAFTVDPVTGATQPNTTQRQGLVAADAARAAVPNPAMNTQWWKSEPMTAPAAAAPAREPLPAVTRGTVRTEYDDNGFAKPRLTMDQMLKAQELQMRGEAAKLAATRQKTPSIAEQAAGMMIGRMQQQLAAAKTPQERDAVNRALYDFILGINKGRPFENFLSEQGRQGAD